jgi:cation:H+ antiporter
VLALYWGWRRRADVVYSSQLGDGHICIPLCVGFFALVRPLPMAIFANQALLLLMGCAVLHAAFLLLTGGLPRWAGAALACAYGWFVYAGMLA